MSNPVCAPSRKKTMAIHTDFTKEKKQGKCGNCKYFYLTEKTEHRAVYRKGNSTPYYQPILHQAGHCTLLPKWECVADYDDTDARWEHHCSKFILTNKPQLYKNEKPVIKKNDVVKSAEKIISAAQKAYKP